MRGFCAAESCKKRLIDLKKVKYDIFLPFKGVIMPETGIFAVFKRIADIFDL